MQTLLVTILPSLACCLLLTPVIRRCAQRLDIVDRPDGRRKLHAHSTPLGGGVAVLISSVLTLTALALWHPWWSHSLQQELPFLAALGLAALLIVIVGLADDRFSLRGRQKLMGQLAAASLLPLSGLIISDVTLLHWKVELGLFAVPFTLFWLLGAINALNLIDGLDGLASSVGIVLSLAIAGMAWLTGHPADAIVAMVVAGSLAGFLYYNAPPASIFLGDAGSMLVGLVLGALAIRSALKGPATIALSAPTAIWAIPIFDVLMAILRRKLTGRSLYSTDQGHLHHCLQRRGYRGLKAVAWIGFLCGCTCLAALVSELAQNELLALGGVAAVLGTMILTRFFGTPECILLCRRLRHVLISLLPSHPRRQPVSRELCTQLRGHCDWDDLWKSLTAFAERFDLCRIELNVNSPALHEEFHATWDRKQSAEGDDLWNSEIPLVAGNLAIGRLRIAGPRGDRGSMCHWMVELISGLKPFETAMAALLEQRRQDETALQEVRGSQRLPTGRHSTDSVGVGTS